MLAPQLMNPPSMRDAIWIDRRDFVAINEHKKLGAIAGEQRRGSNIRRHGPAVREGAKAGSKSRSLRGSSQIISLQRTGASKRTAREAKMKKAP